MNKIARTAVSFIWVRSSHTTVEPVDEGKSQPSGGQPRLFGEKWKMCTTSTIETKMWNFFVVRVECYLPSTVKLWSRVWV